MVLSSSIRCPASGAAKKRQLPSEWGDAGGCLLIIFRLVNQRTSLTPRALLKVHSKPTEKWSNQTRMLGGWILGYFFFRYPPGRYWLGSLKPLLPVANWETNPMNPSIVVRPPGQNMKNIFPVVIDSPSKPAGENINIFLSKWKNLGDFPRSSGPAFTTCPDLSTPRRDSLSR